MDRRSFLKASGALVAVSQLPSFAKDSQATPSGDIFPSRGGYERLALSYTTIELGAEKPFSALHISDTHLTAVYDHEDDRKQELHKVRTRTFGSHQEEALVDSLNWARKNTDFIIHTGDLIDFQSEANLDLVKKYFGPAMTGAMGNHEFQQYAWLAEPKEPRTQEWKEVSKDVLSEAYPFDIELCSQVVNGVNFITLENVYGGVTPSQVERFHEEAKKGLPIILCMHVPFFSDRIWRETTKFWGGTANRFTDATIPDPRGDYKVQVEDPTTKNFIAYLKKEKLLRGILSGHEHINMQDVFSKTATQYVVGGNFLFQGREILFF